MTIDASKLGISYQPMVQAQTPQARKPIDLPSLGVEEPQAELQLRNNKLELFHSGLSGERALLALDVKTNLNFVDGEASSEPGKLRSPLLQKKAQLLAREYVADPLAAAWKNKEFDGEAARALGLGLGGAAAAIYGPNEVKSKLTLFKGHIGDYTLKPSIGITSGYGDIDCGSAKLGFSPTRQGKTHWNVDLEYRPENDGVGLNYNRAMNQVRVGPARGVSYLQATVGHDEESGPRGELRYRLNF